jgi:hypothetical protein
MTTSVSRSVGAAKAYGVRLHNCVIRRSSTLSKSAAEKLNGVPVPGGGRSFADLVHARALDVAVDLQVLRPGDYLEIPYELTITDTFADLWHSAFSSHDRLQTSTPFARKLGFQDRVLPFGLLAFLCASMSHADKAKIEVGFGNIQYLWPGFPGDTYTKRFQVQSVRNTSDGAHSIIHFECNLYNQRGRLCMRADKRMLFETRLVENSLDLHDGVEHDLLRNHILSQASILTNESHSLNHLRQGQLIRHDHARSLTLGQVQQLASLARLTHPRHFVGPDRLVPSGLIVGLCQSASARELHEVLHEQVLNAQFCNPVRPDATVVGALSYISQIRPAVHLGDLEDLTVRTIAVDVASKDLPNSLPLELLSSPKPMKPKELEEFCVAHCPELSGRILLQMDRQILRQSTSKPDSVFLL